MSCRFSIESCIGSGCTCSVYKSFDLKKRRTVVLKVVPSEHLELFLQEVKILRILKRHKNIIKMYSRSKENQEIVNGQDNTNYVIALEYFPMDLFSFIQKNLGGISHISVIHIMRNVSNAVKHCHENCIAHLDIKPENILVSEDLTKIKLSDFGGSKKWSESRTTIDSTTSSTPIYCAPEINYPPFLGDKADIWSLGVVFHLLCCRTFPFPGTTEEEQAENAKHAVIKIDSSFPIQFVSILSKMLDVDPLERPTAEIVFAVLSGFQY